MSNNSFKTGLIRIAVAAMAAAILAACAAQPPQPEPESPPEKVYSFEPWEGDGMDIPLDGSSLEAFETSLARVEAHTTPDDYTTLRNAIEYLLVYDLSANRDRARLAANLDGLTPREVIAKVNWGVKRPGNTSAERRRANDTLDL